MKIAAEHLVARAQGDPQPAERRGDGACSSSTRSPWPIYIAGDRAPRARSTTRRSRSSTRTARRCPRSCSTPSIRRASSCPVLIGADEVAGRRWTAGSFMFVVVDPAALRARPARRAQPGHPGEHRRDRHAAGRHRRRLHQEHHQRSRSRRSCSAPTSTRATPVNLVVRKLFNPNGVSSWFKSVVAIINQITLLTVVLTGAAVIREREHGTLEHLLVMPLTAFEIAMAKVWANGLVILRRDRRCRCSWSCRWR